MYAQRYMMHKNFYFSIPTLELIIISTQYFFQQNLPKMSRANYAILPKGQSPQELGLGRKRKDNDIVATESENLSSDNQQKKQIEINLVDNDAGNKDDDSNKNNEENNKAY